MSNQQAIDEFVGITGIATSVAEQYLARNEYDVMLAVNDYYNNEHVEPGSKPETSSNTNKRSTQSTGAKVKSFSDLNKSNNNYNNDDSDDNDMNFFTGGQKSGLAVEDPNKSKNGRSLVDDLIEKAEKESGEPDWRENDENNDTQNPKKKLFKGTGFSLGSIENEINSKTVIDPESANEVNKPGKVTRTITFWKEGFNVDDGELYKYDDPQNQSYLKQLNMGRAPLSLLNVQMFQDVDVNVVKKLDDSYYDNQKSKPRVFGFQGTGNRLGSPVPGEPIAVEESNNNNTTTTTSITEPTKPIEEEQIGDTSIQIRLASGERIVRKFNSTDLVEEIYKFIENKTVDSNRSWGVVTSFPPQPLDEKKNLSIAEAGLKNSVVIQKWL